MATNVQFLGITEKLDNRSQLTAKFIGTVKAKKVFVKSISLAVESKNVRAESISLAVESKNVRAESISLASKSKND